MVTIITQSASILGSAITQTDSERRCNDTSSKDRIPGAQSAEPRLEVESVWMVDLHKDAVIFRLLEMTGRPAEAWMVAQRDLLEEAHRRCIRLEKALCHP